MSGFSVVNMYVAGRCRGENQPLVSSYLPTRLGTRSALPNISRRSNTSVPSTCCVCRCRSLINSVPTAESFPATHHVSRQHASSESYSYRVYVDLLALPTGHALLPQWSRTCRSQSPRTVSLSLLSC